MSPLIHSIHTKSLERKFCTLNQAARALSYVMDQVCSAVESHYGFSLIFYIPPSLPPLDGQDPVCIFRLGRGVFKVCTSQLAVLNQLFPHVHSNPNPISTSLLTLFSSISILSLFQRMREACLWGHRCTCFSHMHSLEGNPADIKDAHSNGIWTKVVFFADFRPPIFL